MSFTAKTVVLDFADNWGNGSYLGLRAIDFYLSSVLVEVGVGSGTAYKTSTFAGNDSKYGPALAFVTSLTKAGTWDYTNYLSASPTNQRIIFVFSSEIEFDQIIITNSHSSGNYTNSGAKNVVITITPDTYTTTTYGAAVTNGTEIFDGQFDEHVASDVADPQDLTLTAPADALTASDLTGGTPVLGSPTIVQVHPLVSTNLVSGIPSIAAPNLGQVHSLTATTFVSGTPVVNTPNLAESNQLVSLDIISGSPEVATTTVGQVHIITAANIESASALVDTPSFGQTHILSTGNLYTASPSVTEPTLVQTCPLDSTNIYTAQPSVGTPEVVSLTALVAANIETANPIVGFSTLGQVHSLGSTPIITGQPVLSAPNVSDGVTSLYVLDLLAGIPSVEATSILQIQQLVASNISARAPTLESPELNKILSFSDVSPDHVWILPVHDRTWMLPLHDRVWNIPIHNRTWLIEK